MRGKARLHGRVEREIGITPAYAGKREKSDDAFLTKLDHPRVCGEKVVVQVANFQIVGSPPRMRGKGGVRDPDELGQRITPAYAGKRG